MYMEHRSLSENIENLESLLSVILAALSSGEYDAREISDVICYYALDDLSKIRSKARELEERMRSKYDV